MLEIHEYLVVFWTFEAITEKKNTFEVQIRNIECDDLSNHTTEILYALGQRKVDDW